MKDKICVIGGSGFVGTNLCQSLFDQNIDFEIVDIKPSLRFPDRYKLADVRDKLTLEKAITGTVVVNLAAVHRDDVHDNMDYFRTNVIGAENVTMVCSEKNIKKIVFTSSVAVYGFAKPDTDEEGNIRPFNEYGRTKYLAEEKFRDWNKAEDNKLIIVRPTVIFGEGNRGNVFNLFNQVASGKFVMIGSGTNRKSMAFIGNVVAFLERCIKTDKKYAIYNYVDKPDFDMNTLIKQVRMTLKVKPSIDIRLPYVFGILIGYLADLTAFLTGKKLPISGIRVKKFCSTTEFASSSHKLDDFVAPFKLHEGIDSTLRSEFISPDPNREIFFTE